MERIKILAFGIIASFLIILIVTYGFSLAYYFEKILSLDFDRLCDKLGNPYCSYRDSLTAIMILDLILANLTAILLLLLIFTATPFIKVAFGVLWLLVLIARQVAAIFWLSNEVHDYFNDLNYSESIYINAYKGEVIDLIVLTFLALIYGIIFIRANGLIEQEKEA